jgi:hypothetical protein
MHVYPQRTKYWTDYFQAYNSGQFYLFPSTQRLFKYITI